uniref:Isocitrate and isopropylmalate dehydrogenases family n=1 Tax=Tanacetum cinerariifolium TaxID=118510 RepID=A0A6L2K0W7_TANCI|nr:isocitrate and isopropylmalate dehydrogenases family [Tanacetum cinerariifolium]
MHADSLSLGDKESKQSTEHHDDTLNEELSDYADHLETAQKRVIYEGKYHTKDLRGSTTTKEATNGVESALQ